MCCLSAEKGDSKGNFAPLCVARPTARPTGGEGEGSISEALYAGCAVGRLCEVGNVGDCLGVTGIIAIFVALFLVRLSPSLFYIAERLSSSLSHTAERLSSIGKKGGSYSLGPSFFVLWRLGAVTAVSSDGGVWCRDWWCAVAAVSSDSGVRWGIGVGGC